MAKRRKTTKGKRKRLTKKQRGLLGIAALAGIAWYLYGRKGDAGAQVELAMHPADVAANELVSATKYRLIEKARPGMTLAPVSGGGLGSKVEFSSPVSGRFTRNLVQEGGQLSAEIA